MNHYRPLSLCTGIKAVQSKRDDHEHPERKKYSRKIDDLEASSDSETDEDEGEAKAAEEKPGEKQKVQQCNLDSRLLSRCALVVTCLKSIYKSGFNDM